MAEPARRTPADLGWTGEVHVHMWDPLLDDGAVVTFNMIVSAHRVAVDRDREKEIRREARELRRLLRVKFERQHGPIQNSYFCGHVQGGAAIVERDGNRELHTILNSSLDRLVALEAECHALAHQLRTALSRVPGQLEPLTDALFSAMTRVLAAADLAERTDVPDEVRIAALNAAELEFAHAGVRVRAAIQRQARFVYFQGALAGTVVALGIGAGLGMLSAHYWSANVNTAALVAAMVFGALGAVVSVFQRISTDRLVLDFNASGWQLRSLGALRPAVGAIFGTVAQFALATGLLGTTGPPAATSFGVFALIGFAAGFSERFATDMVERAGKVIAATAPEPPAS